MPSPPLSPLSTNFDEETDVVVIGTGIAGLASAIEAHDRGLEVLLIEKMDVPGGTSVMAGGGFCTADDEEKAFSYLKTTNDGTTPDDVLRVFAHHLTQVEAYVQKLATSHGARTHSLKAAGPYPFPGYDTFGYVEVREVPGFNPLRDWPHVQGEYGAQAVKLLLDHAASRNIEPRFNHPARRLITDTQRNVTGIWVEQEQQFHAVRARVGVVLACGGFEAAADLQRQYWQLNPVLPIGFRGNTGDGIRMGVDVGADLWHMWHLHGAYGLKHPDPSYPLGIRMKQLPTWTPGLEQPQVKMTWILVDRDGHRFMNEYPPYLQDTGHRPLDVFSAQRMGFAHLPAFAIVDDVGRKLYPLGDPKLNDTKLEPLNWSDDNLAEVEKGFLKQADDLQALAHIIGCNETALEATLTRWNNACESATDDEFQRPPKTMIPLKRAPFFVAEVAPVVSNTQGGLVHDVDQRVLNPFGEAIDGLYVAGEVGSIWGHLYMGGGNLSEGIIGAQIAARDLATRAGSSVQR